MRLWATLLLLTSSSLLSAGPFSSITLCSIPATTSTDNPCALSGYYPEFETASAFSTATFSIEGNSFSVSMYSYAEAGPNDYASATTTFRDQFTTLGPVRTGLARGIFDYSAGNYGGDYDYGVKFPGSPPGWFGTFGLAYPIPITLGQPFLIDAFGRAEAATDDGTPSYASLQTGLMLWFYEADGMTPVAVAESPEPPMLATFGLAVFGLVLWRRPRPVSNWAD